MAGDEHGELEIGATGVAGDRAYGVLDHHSGTVLSAKREGRLLEARAALVEDVLVVTLPSGERFERGPKLDEALSQWLGRSLSVVVAAAFGRATFECPEDFERDDSEVVSWQGVAGSFVDESPLHILSVADLARLGEERPDLTWDVRRFRPNIVVDDAHGVLEAGRRLRVGAAEVEVTGGCTRCVMTTRSQPGGLGRELDVLRHVARHHDNVVGWRARITTPGRVGVGDQLSA